MAKSKVNLDGGGTAIPPASSGTAATKSSGVIWAGGVAPWPGSALDVQRQGPAQVAPDVRPPGPTSSTAQFDRPQAVVIMGPKPLPVTIEGGMRGGGGGGGQRRARGPTDASRRARLARVTATGVQMAAGAGMVGTGLAQNQAMPMLAGAAMTASRGLAMLGPVGMAAAAGLTVVTAAVGAFKAVVDAFVQRGRELSGLNAGLAASSARADVTRIRADIREADRLGPQMARLIDNQVKAETTLREMLLPIKNFLLKVLNTVIETGLKGLDGMLAALEGILEGVRIMTANVLGKELLDEVKNIRKTLKDDPNADGKDLLGPLLDQIDALAAPAAFPAIPAPLGPMGVPVVGGVL